MVAHAEILPPLAADDRRRLLAFVSANEDIDALIAAESSAASPPDIIDILQWLNHPDIAAWLNQLRQRRAESARRTAIDALEAVTREVTDPIEKRRAASALLRALATPRRTSTEDSVRRSPRLPRFEPTELPSSPDLDAARDQFFAHAPNHIDPDPAALTPHPEVRPLHIACSMIAAMQRAKPDDLQTLFNHSGITDRSPDSFRSFCEGIDELRNHVSGLCDVSAHEQTDDHAYTCTFAIQDSSPPRRITLHLFRPTAGPLAYCWLLDFFRDSS